MIKKKIIRANRPFEVKNKNENKIYRIRTEIKSINVNDSELKFKIKKKDNFVKMLAETDIRGLF